MKPQLIVIRGVACSGKSTIAEKLREEFPKNKTAVIHTEIFYHEIVYGDVPEIAMENTKRILDNYLKNRYFVILEGTLSFKDRNGKLYTDYFTGIAKHYKIPVKKFFFVASLKELERRERKRKKITSESLRRFYKLALKSRKNDEIVIDSTNKSVMQVLTEIKHYLMV